MKLYEGRHIPDNEFDIFETVSHEGLVINKNQKLRLQTANGEFAGEVFFDGTSWILEFPKGTLGMEISEKPLLLGKGNKPKTVTLHIMDKNGARVQITEVDGFAINLADVESDELRMAINKEGNLELRGESDTRKKNIFICAKKIDEEFSNYCRYLKPDTYIEIGVNEEVYKGQVEPGKMARFMFSDGITELGRCYQKRRQMDFFGSQHRG